MSTLRKVPMPRQSYAPCFWSQSALKGGCGYWKSGEKEGKEVKVLETLEPVKGAQAGSVSSSSELSILPILTRNQSQPQPPTHLGKHHSCHLTPRLAIL